MSHAGVADSIGHGEHVALFFTDHDEVIPEIAELTARHLRGGAVAILVLASARLDRIATRLAADGLDVDAHRRNGDLRLIDAAEITSACADGRFDQGRFDAVVTDLLDTLDPARRVLVYGEAVSELWEAGDVTATMQLEHAWAQFLGRVPLTLICGYRSEAAAGGALPESLDDICALHPKLLTHTAVRPVLELTAAFEPDLSAAREARRFVTAALERWRCGASTIEDAQLITSELATNAIVHARTEFTVSVRLAGGHLRIEVEDGSAAAATPRAPGRAAPSGNGLNFVGAIAQEWGTTAHDGGKAVWAVLAVARAHEPPQPADLPSAKCQGS